MPTMSHRHPVELPVGCQRGAKLAHGMCGGMPTISYGIQAGCRMGCPRGAHRMPTGCPRDAHGMPTIPYGMPMVRPIGCRMECSWNAHGMPITLLSGCLKNAHDIPNPNADLEENKLLTGRTCHSLGRERESSKKYPISDVFGLRNPRRSETIVVEK